MIFNYSEISQKERTHLLYSTIIPRPIAWIVTEESNGVVNIAPFSFFAGVSSTPPVVMVAIGNRKDGTPKDTLRNIRESRKATICVVAENEMDSMIDSATPIPANESEAEKFNIAIERVFKDFPPMVRGGQTALFCELHSEIEFKGNTTPIFLEVKQQFAKDQIFNGESIDLDVIGRVGKSYTKLSDI